MKHETILFLKDILVTNIENKYFLKLKRFLKSLKIKKKNIFSSYYIPHIAY